MNRGNYYRRKTKKWFEDKGYFADYLEKNQRIFTNGQIIFIKKDVAGADGMAMNGKEMIFWQSKLGNKNVAKAIKEFKSYPYPPSVGRWIIVWTPRGREPYIEIVNGD